MSTFCAKMPLLCLTLWYTAHKAYSCLCTNLLERRQFVEKYREMDAFILTLKLGINRVTLSKIINV